MENKEKFGIEKHLDIVKIQAIDEEERTVTAIISSDAVDRDSEVLLPKGMDSTRFEENAVVLFAHNSHEPPIGKAIWIKTKGKNVIAGVKFATTAFAEEIWQLFKGGFLKAFSVGFIPIDGRKPEPKDIVKNPEWANARFIYTKWELLEFSAVPVPANPDALVAAVKNKSIKLSDETKNLFCDTFEEEINTVELEIKKPDVELYPVKEIDLIPDIDLHKTAGSVTVGEMTDEAIKILKGVMFYDEPE